MARFRAVAVVALLLAGLGRMGEAAPQTPRDLYAAALAREQALRTDRSPTLKDYRAAVAAYDAVVRRSPTSGYVDNALWQGAALALEAFDRFSEDRDQGTARRMLELLANEYRFSPLSGKARDTLKRMDAKKAAPDPPPEPAAAPKSPPKRLAVLKDIRRATAGDRIRITIELDAQAAYRTEGVESPRRMFVDIADSRLGASLAEGTRSFNEDVVRRVRIGRHPNDTTRVVVDLDGIKRYTVSALSDPFRIIVECERAAVLPTPPPPQAPPVQASPTAEAKDSTTIPLPVPPEVQVVVKTPAPPPRAPKPKPLPSRPVAQAAMPAPEAASMDVWSLLDRTPPAPATRPRTAVVTTAADPPLPPSPAPGPEPSAAAGSEKPVASIVPPRGSYSLSRQLGLGASKIVIDPGHGGHDPGALGQGVSEAEIVLDVALRLEALLRDGGFDVVLTRRTDEFIPLEERPAIATREQADLFLSVHANASRNRAARGIETYFLNFSNDPDAEAVAVRENAATERRMNNLPEIVKAITLNNKLDESRSFAGLIQRALAQQLRSTGATVTDHGVKQAPFVVLIGAAMPSVLVEVSFITNTQEGRQLKTPAFRQRIAQALFDGIRGYQRSLKGVTPALRQ
jgi:N-acetylmuramoyl-L-alanine amidase